MSTSINLKTCVNSKQYDVALKVTASVALVAGVVTVFALLVIFFNHINGARLDNHLLLRPNVLAVFWSIAKWSGIAGAPFLGTALVLSALKYKNKT